MFMGKAGRDDFEADVAAISARPSIWKSAHERNTLAAVSRVTARATVGARVPSTFFTSMKDIEGTIRDSVRAS
jgi:hypothetical protein